MSLRTFLRPRKRFGQNFLRDPLVIEKIIKAVRPQSEDRVVEIGPGLGALTHSLVDHLNKLDVVEIDRDLAHELQTIFQDRKELTIHVQDALTFKLSTLNTRDNNPQKIRVIGNLPYNISTPLIFHLLEEAHLIQDMYFMLQKEVVERLSAKPQCKDYGRLTVMVQYFCEVTPLFMVEPTAFYPIPKVHSQLVALIPHQKLPSPALDLSILQAITKTAFSQRRKTLSNALKPYLTARDFTALDLNPSLRPEALSVADFVQISNYIVTHPKQLT